MTDDRPTVPGTAPDFAAVPPAAGPPGAAGRTSRRLRWGLPVAAVVTVAAAVAVPAAMAAGDPKGLAPRTAGALLTDLAGAKATPVSGTVVQTARLGLPKLPAGTTGTDPMALASGSHTLRVWTDGQDRTRLALLGRLAEYDVVRDGASVWTYRSEKNEAVHYTLPARAAGEPGAAGRTAPPGQRPLALPATPQQAADQVLAALTPTTEVTVGDAVKVAGHDAYTLVLTPRDRGSLVGSVRLAVDSATAVPLRVQVFGSGDTSVPALEVGFTDVSFTAPAASVFSFRAPAGAKVTEQAVPAPGDGAASGDRARGQDATPDAVPGTAPDSPDADSPDAGGGQAAAPEVRGTGWTSIVVVKGVDTAGLGSTDPRLLDALTTRVAEGRLLTTKLVSVLLTDDGRVLAGAVTPEVLRAAAR